VIIGCGVVIIGDGYGEIMVVNLTIIVIEVNVMGDYVIIVQLLD